LRKRHAYPFAQQANNGSTQKNPFKNQWLGNIYETVDLIVAISFIECKEISIAKHIISQPTPQATGMQTFC
jgi:hypothetical protein